MSISINIENINTISYRTDCMKQNYKHYIRNHDVTHSGEDLYKNGYVHKYENIEGHDPNGNKHSYNIGYNPYYPFPSNPIVCNNLLMFGSFKITHQLQNIVYDLCYDKLIFNRPVLLINDLRDSSFLYNKIYYTISSGLFILLDELSVNEHDNTSHIKRIFGKGTYYDGHYKQMSDRELCIIRNSNGDECRFSNNIDICIEYPMIFKPFNPYYSLGYNGLKDFICSKNELLSRFAYVGESEPEVCNVLESFEYGALMIPRRALFVQSKFNDHYDFYYPSVRGATFFPFYDLFEVTIIPFIDDNEYNAAYASIYTWTDNVI